MSTVNHTPADDAAANDPGAGEAGALLADLRGGDNPEFGGFGRPARRVPVQHVITAVVAIAGGGVLLAMRQYGMGAGMRLDPTMKVDVVETSSGRLNADQARVLRDLERGVMGEPVTGDDIDKNPFLFALTPNLAALPGIHDADADARERHAKAAQARRDEINGALDRIAVQAVMEGTVPLARINGQIVKVGDVLYNVLTVTAIQGRAVEVVADGQSYRIEMGDESGAGRPGGRRGR